MRPSAGANIGTGGVLGVRTGSRRTCRELASADGRGGAADRPTEPPSAYRSSPTPSRARISAWLCRAGWWWAHFATSTPASSPGPAKPQRMGRLGAGARAIPPRPPHDI